MRFTKKTYTREGLVVNWEPYKCIHSGNCIRGLPKVFGPDNKPWVNVNAASKEEIYDQIKKCPSGALSAEMDQKV